MEYIQLSIDEINNLSKNNDILLERNDKLRQALEDIQKIINEVLK